jgi:hypothetical protein
MTFTYIALGYQAVVVLLFSGAAVTALRAPDPARRADALRVLKQVAATLAVCSAVVAGAPGPVPG